MDDERHKGRRSSIGDARAFTPRGRTMRDSPADRRADRRAETPPQSRGDQPRKRAPHKVVAHQVMTKPAEKQGVSSKAGPPRLGEPRRRLRLATAISLLLFAIIGLRLVQLQVTDAPAYAAAGLNQRLARIDLPAPRGSILDRSGAVLAHSIEARYVAADPSMVLDVPAAAAALSPLLGIAVSELVPKLADKSTRFVYLARGVDVEDAQRIKDLDLPGIRVERDERRVVPGADLAANIIGFTGTDLNGLGGVESRFDELLRGKDGRFVFEVGQGELRKPIPGGYQVLTPAKPGSSLKLTIDRDVQYMTQRILYEAMSRKGATWAAAMVLDSRTGEVVAQASYPTFNAANWQAAKPEEREDMATRVVVDPGSIHKAIVLGAALQEGVINTGSVIEIAPTIRKGGVTYSDTHPFPAGTRITMPGLAAYSSNVGTIKVAEMLGPQKLYDYQRLFGLGEPTGISVPGESAGMVRSPDTWSGTDHGSVPIGHGVAVTPLQMAAAFAAIANDGVWVQPHLVQESIAPDGTISRPDPANSHRVLSPETAAQLRQIMEAVTVVDDATGVTARLPGYRIAGKTGTGKQVKDGHYIPGEVASFIGMAPADQPRYVIAVFAHTPGGGGGDVAGPAFRDMMAFTLSHFRVPPTGTNPPEFTVTS